MTSPAPLVQVVTLDTLHGQMGMPCTTLLFLEDAHVLKPGKMRRMRFMKTSKSRAMRAIHHVFTVREGQHRVEVFSLDEPTNLGLCTTSRTLDSPQHVPRDPLQTTRKAPTHQQQHPRCFPAHQQHARELRRRIQLSPGIPRHCQCFDLAMA